MKQGPMIIGLLFLFWRVDNCVLRRKVHGSQWMTNKVKAIEELFARGEWSKEGTTLKKETVLNLSNILGIIN